MTHFHFKNTIRKKSYMPQAAAISPPLPSVKVSASASKDRGPGLDTHSSATSCSSSQASLWVSWLLPVLLQVHMRWLYFSSRASYSLKEQTLRKIRYSMWNRNQDQQLLPLQTETQLQTLNNCTHHYQPDPQKQAGIRSAQTIPLIVFYISQSYVVPPSAFFLY